MTTANRDKANTWNGDSGHRWAADADRRDHVTQPVADALFDAARLRPGETVLDIGCGCGITTLAAAAAVRPGRATGIDLSEPMLDVARQRAGNRAGVTFLRADAQTHRFTPATFDVAISRFGTMFFDDPVAAFANVAAAVHPGGRLCLATWQSLAANEWLTVPGVALLRFGSVPDLGEGRSGMFAQSDPTVVADVLHAAGWHDVEVAPVALDARTRRRPGARGAVSRRLRPWPGGARDRRRTGSAPGHRRCCRHTCRLPRPRRCAPRRRDLRHHSPGRAIAVG